MSRPPVSVRLGRSASALHAFFLAEELFATLLGRRLAAFRESGGASAAAFARIQELELRVALLSRWIDVLTARWERLPERRRPHYDASQRFEIVSLKRSEALTAREAARRAAVSIGTIHRWEAGAARAEGTIGGRSLVKPAPPIRRMSDAVRVLVKEMDAAGFGGARSVALHLARAGMKLSATSVRRIRREPTSPPSVPLLRLPGRRLEARRPGDVGSAISRTSPAGSAHFASRSAS